MPPSRRTANPAEAVDSPPGTIAPPINKFHAHMPEVHPNPTTETVSPPPQPPKVAASPSQPITLPSTASPTKAVASPSESTVIPADAAPLPEEDPNPTTETVDSPSHSTVSPNEVVTSPSESTAITTDAAHTPKESKFWQKAVEEFAKGYKIPEEWRKPEPGGKDIIDTVRTKMEECKDKQWKISINGEEITVREVFGKILDWVQKFAAVGDAAVQYDPVNAALPWAAFRLLLQVAVNDKETYGTMLAGLERATWLTTYCWAQERLYTDYFANKTKYSELNEALLKDLVQLYRAILKFLLQAHTYYAKGTTARIAGAIISSSSWVEDLMKAIESSKLRMEDYASLVHKINVHQDLKDMLGMLEPFSKYMSDETKRREEKERRGFMKWLSDVDYRKDHEANSRNILTDSGNWMLDNKEFCSWKEGGSLFWLRGIPGAGKTKLTSTIINHLMRTDENHTVAYFYCVRDTQKPKNEDPEEILRAILKQLVILLPSQLSKKVKDKYEEEKKQGRDHGSIRTLTFEECAYFIGELANGRPVTIVIDALDECREDKHQSSQGSHKDRRDLLKELIAAEHGNVKVFLSGRDDVDIMHQLQKYPNITINASKNGPDILRFVEAEVGVLIETKEYMWGGDSSLKEEIIMSLNTRADGMFRSAALQISYLSSLETRESVVKRLGELPGTLHKLHDEIYQRISAMKEETFIIVRNTLSWLLCARRQLHSGEIMAAVSTGPDQLVGINHLLHLCRNLVVLNPVSESFEFAHLSVREYLETHEEYKDGQAHALIAKRCIKLFEPDVPRGILDKYASLYWVDHYKNRPQTEEDGLTDMAKNFFRDKGVNQAFEAWVKVAKESSKVLPWSDDLTRRLHDAGYKPLSVICVFGLPKLLDQWMVTGYSHFRDSDEMAVHLAIKWGNTEVVRSLLEQDDQAAIDKFGFTSPFWAVFYKQSSVLQMLKELPGGVDAEDEMGWTALDWMVVFRDIAGLELLLSVGAGKVKENEAKWTPLHWAVILGCETETKELVANHMANKKDCDGLTPFQWAEFLGNQAITVHLRPNEADGSFRSSLRINPEVKLDVR